MNKFKKKLSSAITTAFAFPLTTHGFEGFIARKWVKEACSSYRNRNFTFKERCWAVRRGYSPVQVKNLGITAENLKNTISAKDYAYLQPLNDIYSKWISDAVTINAVFKPFRKYMPERYYQLSKRDFDTLIIPLNGTQGDTVSDILALLKEKGALQFMTTSQFSSATVTCDCSENYTWNGNPIPKDLLEQLLSSTGKNIIISEKVCSCREFSGAKLSLVITNEQGDNPRINDAHVRFLRTEEDTAKAIKADCKFLSKEENDKSDIVQIENDTTAENEAQLCGLYYAVDRETGQLIYVPGENDPEQKNLITGEPIPGAVPCWQEITELIDKLCRFVPQLEFLGLDIRITDDGFRIMRFMNDPPYPARIPFSKETSDYLKLKLAQKKHFYTFSKRFVRGCKKIKQHVRKLFTYLFFPKSLLPYLSTKFIGDIRKDFVTNKDTTFKEKKWAIRHGFISYRLHQYGITEENWTDYISDFEYKWLRHINNKYRLWMEDKITVKYICSDYNECFPEYYYHIILKNGSNKILPMMDCPEGYKGTIEDIFRLVREKESLALKPDEGSHGDGFYKFTYRDGRYYLNHKEATEDDVIAILNDPGNQYLVTEYINMHDEIKRIYAGAVNTIRMIVFKKDGKNPVIGNAYMRFGSRRTGAVDNMGAGGMFAKIDIDTGKFYDAKIIEANEIKPCLYHPDTNEKIEGYLPNWEKVKASVLDVARSIPQLEYFGFDLALTETGLKFPEINRFPDYPAIEKYTNKTMDYLLYKLDVKKIKYGYPKKKGKKLFDLPDRPIKHVLSKKKG